MHRLDAINKYIAENHDQLPRDAWEADRAKLNELHFRENDVSDKFFPINLLPIVQKGMIAYLAALDSKDLKASCRTATLLKRGGYRIMVLDGPPIVVTGVERKRFEALIRYCQAIKNWIPFCRRH